MISEHLRAAHTPESTSDHPVFLLRAQYRPSRNALLTGFRPKLARVCAAISFGRRVGPACVPVGGRCAQGLAPLPCDTRAVPSERDRRRVDEIPRLLAYRITRAGRAFLQRSRVPACLQASRQIELPRRRVTLAIGRPQTASGSVIGARGNARRGPAAGAGVGRLGRASEGRGLGVQRRGAFDHVSRKTRR